MKRIVLTALVISAFSVFFVLPFKPFDRVTADLHARNSQEREGLSKEEAQELLKKLNVPDARILEVRMSPVKGLWEVAIESRGKKGVAYIDISKKYFISGSIISIEEQKNLTQDRLIEITKVDVSRIPLDDALLLGDKEAAKKVIVFTDPD